MSLRGHLPKAANGEEVLEGGFELPPDPSIEKAKEARRKKAKKDGQEEPGVVHPSVLESEDPFQSKFTPEEAELLHQFGFFERWNRVWCLTGANPQPVSNFTMRILYRMDSDQLPRRVVELTNDAKRRVTVELTGEKLLSPDVLNAVIINKGKYLWTGSKAQLGKYLLWLTDQETSCVPLDVLGWQPDIGIWAWGNGLYNGQFVAPDVKGVVQHEKRHFYLPSAGDANRFNPDYQDERKFSHRPGSVDMATWANSIEAVYGSNGRVAVAFVFASLFRDFIRERTKSFPMLFLFGQPRSGKSALATSMMALFGDPQDSISLSGPSSNKAFMRRFGQLRNAVVYLEEYKNGCDQRTLEALKNIWDGIGYTNARMTNDSRTKTHPIFSSALICGQEMPTAEPALFTRVILRTFQRPDDRNQRSDAQLRQFAQLRAWEAEGLTHLTCQVLALRKEIEEGFGNALRDSQAELKAALQLRQIAADERLVLNASVLLATQRILLPKLKLWPLEQIQDDLETGMAAQSTAERGSDELSTWWQTASYLIANKSLEYGIDYNLSIEGEFLYLRLVRAHPMYLESMRRQGRNNALDVQTLRNYLRAHGAFVEEKKSHRFDSGVSSCLVFRRHDLPIEVPDIDLTTPPLPGANF